MSTYFFPFNLLTQSSSSKHKDEYPKKRKHDDEDERRRSNDDYNSSRDSRRNHKDKYDERRRDRDRRDDRKDKVKYEKKSRHRSKSRERDRKKRSPSTSPEPLKSSSNIPKSKETINSLNSSIPSASLSSPNIQATVANPNGNLPAAVNLQLQQLISAATKSAEQQKIELPSYYNPKVVNAVKFAEQQQKRKLLWGGKKEEAAVSGSTALWSSAKFSHDTDGVKANKFMRLMGIKEGKKFYCLFPFFYLFTSISNLLSFSSKCHRTFNWYKNTRTPIQYGTTI